MESLSDIVTLQNIDTEDFQFAYDKHPYIIRAGQIRRFPRFLANHALKHLIDKMLTKQDVRTSHENKRAELAEKIVIDVEEPDEMPAKTEQEILDERVDTLNRPSDLENVLKKHRDTGSTTPEVVETAPPAPTPPPAPTTPPPVVKKQEEAPTVPPPPTTTDVPLKPTRAELYKFATESLKMDMNDKKTKADFDKKTVDELIKGLDYPYPPEGQEE